MRECARCVGAVLLLTLSAVQADGNVSVVWKQLTFEETHELVVNASIEYILPFVPTADQSLWPVRVWIKADGGDTARPLLITARRRIGATTWQLPYRSGGAVLYQLERTLCPDDSVDSEPLRDDCEDPSLSAPGEFSLHVGSSCVASVTVQLRASLARDWLLPFEASTTVNTVQGAPQVHYYQFLPEQRNVRLVVESDDDICSTIAVQNYTCPIAETLEDIEMMTLRMTVQRSGGMQLPRSRFPRGFYVVSLVRDSDEACRAEQPPEDDWLWEAAVLAAQQQQQQGPAPPRAKRLVLRTQAALSRAQYLVGAGVTLVVFLLFYALFGALVLAQRLPRWRRLVGPRAVLANQNKSENDDGTRSEIESAATMSPARRRRDSTATFDSSDNSDTDDDEEEETATATTVATAATAAVSDTASAAHSGPPADVIHTASITHNGAAADVIHTASITHSGPPADVNHTANITHNGAAADVTASPDSVDAGLTVHYGATADVTASPDGGAAPAPRGHDDAPPRNGIYVVDTNAHQVAARPFGLPARLHVAALARRRARVLDARSDRYLYTLYTVGLFYALPVLQFVAAFQIILNVSGSLDVCYYNFLCAHPAGALSDFNHVFSNVGYLLLGALFMLQVRRRKLRRLRKPRHEEYGIPAHYGLLSSLGAAMMMVALLSAAYHVCPNGLNFQFDTAFMYVLAVLSMVKIYQSRHPDINARAHATFGVLAVLIALVVWGVLGGGPLFWSLFTVLHVFTFLLLSLRIYYVGQFRLEKASLQVAARSLAAARGLQPLYTARLVMLLIANAVNWVFALYGLFTQSADFAGHLLSVLLCNTLMHMVFYLSMKLLHGERPRWYAWAYLAAAAAAWSPGLYLFVSGSTDWSTTPALSRQLNHECRVLQFYDSHDLWHILSAVALYFSFNAMLTWDDGLAAVKRTEIAVF